MRICIYLLLQNIYTSPVRILYQITSALLPEAQAFAKRTDGDT